MYVLPPYFTKTHCTLWRSSLGPWKELVHLVYKGVWLPARSRLEAFSRCVGARVCSDSLVTGLKGGGGSWWKIPPLPW